MCSINRPSEAPQTRRLWAGPSLFTPLADQAWEPSPDAPINTQIPYEDDDGDSAFFNGGR